jgi:acetylornithine deacetylase/succinyl-diaminopimelate desuccinylase-like protein
MREKNKLNDKEFAKKYEKDSVKFAQKIIQTPSFSTKEEELIKLVKREMEKVGFDKVKINKKGKHFMI